jgi:hypothetical protein
MQIIRHFDLTVKKSIAVPLHAVEAYGGNRGVVPLILNLGRSWR